MEVKLVVKSGKNAGQEIPISIEKFFIGRAEDCQLRPRSDLISRHHCVILVEKEFVAVRDFGSKNGTLVNGQRVQGEQELSNGDLLKVGQLEFEIQMPTGIGGRKKPKVKSVEEAVARTAETLAPATDDDVDLADWFGEDEDDVSPGAITDTQTVTGAHTEITGAASDDNASEGQAKGPDDDAGRGGQEATKMAPQFDNSYDAAAEALKKLRKS